MQCIYKYIYIHLYNYTIIPLCLRPIYSTLTPSVCLTYRYYISSGGDGYTGSDTVTTTAINEGIYIYIYIYTHYIYTIYTIQYTYIHTLYTIYTIYTHYTHIYTIYIHYILYIGSTSSSSYKTNPYSMDGIYDLQRASNREDLLNILENNYDIGKCIMCIRCVYVLGVLGVLVCVLVLYIV